MLSVECSDGLYCGPTHRCAPAGDGDVGAACVGDQDCAPGLRCGLVNLGFACQPEGTGDLGASCSTSGDCYGGLGCAGGTCTQLPPGAPWYGIPSWDGVACDDAADGPVTAYFRVPRGDAEDGDFYRLPFPNDIRLRDGRPHLTGHPTPGNGMTGFDAVDRYLRAIEEGTDGWGTYPTVLFRFSGAVSWDSLDNNTNPDAIQWLDITPNAAEFGRVHGWYSLASPNRTKYLCANWAAYRPPNGEPLIPGHTYAVVLKSGALATDGTPVARSPDFEVMLADDAPQDAVLAAAHARYAPLRAWLKTKNVAPESILNAAVFTVGPVRKPVEALAATVAEIEPPPATGWVKCGAGVQSPCPQADGDRSCGQESPAFEELHALVELPVFQQGSAPYATPADGAGMTWEAPNKVAVARKEQVCLSLTVPKGGDMPQQGWPLVVFAHGTGGSFRSHVTGGVAEALAAVDPGGGTIVRFAVLGIDQVAHGPRRGSSTAKPDDLFFNFANPLAAKFNPLQGAADQLSLGRFGPTIAFDAATSPTGQAIAIDAGNIVFWGHSQGATEGALGIPYSSAYKAVVLSGQGAGLIHSLLTKTSPVNIPAALPLALLDPAPDGTLEGGVHHPVLGLLQTWMDSSDPISYAEVMSAHPPVEGTVRHLFQPFGQMDTYSTAPTQIAYAWAAHLGRLSDDPSAIVQDPANDSEMNPLQPGAESSGNLLVDGKAVTALTKRYGPDGYDGHFVAFRNANALGDDVRFLARAVSSDEAPAVGP